MASGGETSRVLIAVSRASGKRSIVATASLYMGSTSAGKNARASWESLKDEMDAALQLAPSNTGLGKFDAALASSTLSSIAPAACQLAALGFFNPFDRLGPTDLRPSR
mmetsp:Transcript_125819/g.245401  ORF Transcript_125819/g.245401 Transcript_125819/m.245401 type:complete len:108 (+) Transcript_125819:811-1134(+)